MGIGTLGFLKGAARTGLDSIEAREEAERDIKKQQQLAELRARLEQEAKLATVSDVQYEDRDGVMWHVGYSSNGIKVEGSERPATQYELDKIEQDKQQSEFDKRKQSLDLQRIETGILNDQDQIRSRRVRDSNDTRSTNAQIAASARMGRSGGSGSRSGSAGGGGGLSSGVAGVADLLLNDYKDDIVDVGLTADQARTIANSAVRSLLAEGVTDPDKLYERARFQFENGVTTYKKSMSTNSDYNKFRTKRFSLDGSN